MKTRARTKALFLMFLILIPGCASVPKEVVELSYQVGEDLEALHISYITLIHAHYDGLREMAQTFLNDKWIPVYLNEFINETEFIETINNSDPVEMLEYVQPWVEVAIEEIESKKQELIIPIDNDEKILIQAVDEAFANIYRANSTITAHLNSIRKVKDLQDDVLESMNLRSLRDTVNRELLNSSNDLKTALDKLEKTHKNIQDIKDKKEEIINKLKGE